MTTASDSAKVTLIFTPNLPVLVLGLMLLPLLLWLGNWQMQRADEKQQLLADHQHLIAQPPLPLNVDRSELPTAIPAFTPVTLSGYFDNEHYWLLDNKTYRGRAGYEILQAFILDGAGQGRIVLVNRGWVIGSPDREQLPQVPMVKGLQVLIAHVAAHYSNPLITPGAAVSGWPKRVNTIDLAQFSLDLGQQIDVLVNLEADAGAALTTQWATVNISPQKHLGYAAQWFCMAVALLVLLAFANSNLSGWINSKRNKNKTDDSK